MAFLTFLIWLSKAIHTFKFLSNLFSWAIFGTITPVTVNMRTVHWMYFCWTPCIAFHGIAFSLIYNASIVFLSWVSKGKLTSIPLFPNSFVPTDSFAFTFRRAIPPIWIGMVSLVPSDFRWAPRNIRRIGTCNVFTFSMHFIAILKRKLAFPRAVPTLRTTTCTTCIGIMHCIYHGAVVWYIYYFIYQNNA